MNLTKHFQERWAERIVGVPRTEAKTYVNENQERIALHAAKMMEHASWLYKGAINANPVCNYYLKDDTVIVVNEGNDALVTVYKVDLGFTPELNQTVRKGLVEEIDSLQEKYMDLSVGVEDRLAVKRLEIETLQEKIALMSQEIKDAELSIRFKEEGMKEEQRELRVLENQIKRHTMTLVNSLDYQKDRLLLSR